MKIFILIIQIFFVIGRYSAQPINFTSFFSDSNKFLELRQKRDQLLNEKASLNEKFLNMSRTDDAKFAYSIYDTLYNNDEIKSVTSKLDELKREKIATRSEIDSIQSHLGKLYADRVFYRDYFRSKHNKDSVITSTKITIEKNLVELASVESQINMMMIPEISRQNFMKIISAIFCILIGLLIWLFFSLMRQDSKIRNAIFGGDSGIQFITLFSIVIAIILFGITGTLEGKELSALLGSVSGYILGRVTNKSNSENNTSDQNAEKIPQAKANSPEQVNKDK